MNTYVKTSKVKVLRSILITSILPNPMQPRIVFEEQALRELADTIRERGIEQPLAVEGPLLNGKMQTFILHDGERRWRAAKLAGLKRVPVVVTPPLNGTGPRERLMRALVANVQREEMHPIEEGRGYQRLVKEFGYEPKEVAKKVGKHVSRVYYCLRLLDLDEEIQDLMLTRKLPAQDIGVNALLEIPTSKERIELARALAAKNATAKIIMSACAKYMTIKHGMKKSRKGSPAVAMVDRKAHPEWDALYQVGKVPAWQTFVNAVMATCDACPLRSIASESTCRDCALVSVTRRLMEVTHA